MNEINESKAHRVNEVNQFATFPIVYKEDRCSYCGSISPSMLVEAIKERRRVNFADKKYGCPHILYIDQGYKELFKFYTVYLRDVTEEEKSIIHKAYGLAFKFDVNRLGYIHWSPVTGDSNDNTL